MMGFDTHAMRSWDVDQVEQAQAEGRVVLTRRRELKDITGYLLISHDRVADQLRELSGHLDLKAHVRPLVRCNRCNRELETVGRQAAKAGVPEYVYLNHETFRRCPGCGRIYWQGSHFQGVEIFIKSVLG